MMGPVVAKMADQFDGRIKVGKCNVDENMELAQKYRISSIPAFIVFQNGKPAETFVGAMSESELKGKLERVLG